MVRVQYGGGNKCKVFEFGQGGPMCSVDVQSTAPDLERYVGDEVVRKFPYDPDNPYFETDSIEQVWDETYCFGSAASLCFILSAWTWRVCS